MNSFISIIVPVAVCVVLPIAIVWITTSRQKKQDELRAKVMLGTGSLLFTCLISAGLTLLTIIYTYRTIRSRQPGTII